MNTLEDAWRWYEVTRGNLGLMRRLAVKHWTTLPWDSQLGKDDAFRELDQEDLSDECGFSLTHLDDLAVVVLFSVFEALVRDTVYGEVEQEAQRLQHRALKQAAVEALQWIAEGSFFRVLQPFKEVRADLVEHVNQVRRYRNWVAHGKRGTTPEKVTPLLAYERLGEFLKVAGITPGNTPADPPKGS